MIHHRFLFFSSISLTYSIVSFTSGCFYSVVVASEANLFDLILWKYPKQFTHCHSEFQIHNLYALFEFSYTFILPESILFNSKQVTNLKDEWQQWIFWLALLIFLIMHPLSWLLDNSWFWSHALVVLIHFFLSSQVKAFIVKLWYSI